MLFNFLLFAAVASAHMTLLSPPPFGNPDSSPLSPSGSDFPCKGKLGELSSGPVTDWEAGSTQSFKLSTGAGHGGGSCQASISEDGGKTFKVIKTYIGGCPVDSNGGEFDFEVPSQTKSGNAIFAWTWFNKIGNREMYMNCAAINISGGGSGLQGEEFPDMFTANIGGDCMSNKEGTQAVLEIPNPGPNVVRGSDPTEPPQGSCAGGATANPGSGAGSSSGGSGSGAGTGEGSGAGSGAGAQPTQTFDDGQYHPPTTAVSSPTSAAAGTSAAASAAPSAEAGSGSGSESGSESGSGESSGEGSGAGSGAGAQPTQSFDDGLYHPTSAASSPTSAAASAAPTAKSGSGSDDTAQVYDIVMVINGETQTGKATLSLPTAAPKNKRRMVFRA